jgi:hypothetical protein
MLVVAATIQLLPDTAPYCCGLSVLILSFSFVFLLNTFTYGPADIGVKSSGFPTHMRVLPVSNRALVGWPMLVAVITFAVLWLIQSSLIFLPAGLPIPVLWPATMLAALCVWVQAISWCPMPSPFARVPMLILAFLPMIVPMALGLTFFKGSWLTAVVSASCLIWSAVAYLVGVQGLSRARAGSQGDWLRPIADWWAAQSRRRSAARAARRPFRSAFTAQLWHECRRNAIVLPVMNAFVSAPMFLILLLPILSPDRQQSLLFGSTNIPAPVLCLLMWGGIPILFGLTSGSGMAKLDIWGKTAMPSFYATRPLTTTQFVLIKFYATALSVVASWLITLTLFTIWAIVESSSLNPHRSVIRAILAEATPRGVLIAVLVVVTVVAMTWRNIVSGMWPTLLGRKNLANAIGFAFLGVFSLMGVAGVWVYQHPDYRELFWRILPWFVASELALKIAVAVWLSVALHRREFVSATAMQMLAAGWVLLVACIVGVISMYVTPTWTLAALVALMVPFTSLLSAPLALDWNRHR